MDLQKLYKKYYNHEFENWGGVTSPDYRTFQTAYMNGLKQLCKENNWQLVSFNKNHYEFSAVIKRDDGQHIYFSISDVRYFHNEWANNILVRTMKHEKDWTGGSNNFTDIHNIMKAINQLR